ncbi:hypothetical protein C8Q78DRAFT_1083903 [Trametes maxima]|nr:hypothetical protein C8Q78DRAFT_1083903 [Trametes maxima]
MGRCKWRVQESLLLESLSTSPDGRRLWAAAANKDDAWYNSTVSFFTTGYLAQFEHTCFAEETDEEFALRRTRQPKAELVRYGAETEAERHSRVNGIRAHIESWVKRISPNNSRAKNKQKTTQVQVSRSPLDLAASARLGTLESDKGRATNPLAEFKKSNHPAKPAMTLTASGKPDLANWNHACKVALAELPDRDVFEDSARKHNAERREVVEDPTIGSTREEKAQILPQWMSTICETVGAEVGWVQWFALGGLDENHRIKSIFPGAGDLDGVTFDKWLARKYNWSDDRLQIEFDNYIREIFDPVGRVDGQPQRLNQQPKVLPPNAGASSPTPSAETTPRDHGLALNLGERELARGIVSQPELSTSSANSSVAATQGTSAIVDILALGDTSLSPAQFPPFSSSSRAEPSEGFQTSRSDLSTNVLTLHLPSTTNADQQPREPDAITFEGRSANIGTNSFSAVKPATPPRLSSNGPADVSDSGQKTPQSMRRNDAEVLTDNGVMSRQARGTFNTTVAASDPSTPPLATTPLAAMPMGAAHTVATPPDAPPAVAPPVHAPLAAVPPVAVPLASLRPQRNRVQSARAAGRSLNFNAASRLHNKTHDEEASTIPAASSEGPRGAKRPNPLVPDVLLQKIEQVRIRDHAVQPNSTGRRSKRLPIGKEDTPTPLQPSMMQSSPILPSSAYPALIPSKSPSKLPYVVADDDPTARDAQFAVQLQMDYDQEDEDMGSPTSWHNTSATTPRHLNLAERCANDEQIARHLQEALDDERKDQRIRRADAIQDMMAAKVSRRSSVPYTLRELGAKLASWSGNPCGAGRRTPVEADITMFGPPLEELLTQSGSKSVPDPNSASTPTQRLEPFSFNLDNSSSPSPREQPVSQLSPPSARATSVISIHSSPSLSIGGQARDAGLPHLPSVISIESSSDMGSRVLTNRRFLRRRSVGRTVPQGGTGVDDAISISSDSDDCSRPRLKRAKPENNRTALLDAPFYGMPMDGKDLYQPDIRYPWEDSSSSDSCNDEFAPAPASQSQETLQPNGDVITDFDDVHRFELVVPAGSSTGNPLHGQGSPRYWYATFIIYYRENTLPVTKMVCCDHDGNITVGQHFPVRRVFDAAGVGYFHYWNSSSTSWERKMLTSPLPLSVKSSHTFLLRMTWVRHCPYFDRMLSKTLGNCLFFGPHLPAPAQASPVAPDTHHISSHVEVLVSILKDGGSGRRKVTIRMLESALVDLGFEICRGKGSRYKFRPPSVYGEVALRLHLHGHEIQPYQQDNLKHDMWVLYGWEADTFGLDHRN